MKCQMCGEELRQIPAGISKKTGKPYEAFMSCLNRCKQSSITTTPIQSTVAEDVITRLAIIKSMLESNRDYKEIERDLSKYVILAKGKKPTESEQDIGDIPF